MLYVLVARTIRSTSRQFKKPTLLRVATPFGKKFLSQNFFLLFADTPSIYPNSILDKCRHFFLLLLDSSDTWNHEFVVVF